MLTKNNLSKDDIGKIISINDLMFVFTVPYTSSGKRYFYINTSDSKKEYFCYILVGEFSKRIHSGSIIKSLTATVIKTRKHQFDEKPEFMLFISKIELLGERSLKVNINHV